MRVVSGTAEAEGTREERGERSELGLDEGRAPAVSGWSSAGIAGTGRFSTMLLVGGTLPGGPAGRAPDSSSDSNGDSVRMVTL